MQPRPGWLAPAILYPVLAALAWGSADSLAWLFTVLRYPFGLDYGEGIVLQQALLVPGPRAYGDITAYPFIVFHYPPVYLLLVHALVALGLEPLVAGRATSLAATACVIAFVGYGGWVLGQGLAPRARLLGALVAGMVVLTSPILSLWGAVARVDMVAIACSLGAILLAAHSAGSPRRLHLAVLLAVLAVFTKHTAIAAAAAIVVGLLLTRPRDALRAMVTGLALGALGFAALMLATGGGFFRHIVIYNVNRFSLDHLLDHLVEFALHIGGVPMLLAALALLLVVPGMLGPGWTAAARRAEIGATPRLLLLVMACAALGISTLMLGLLAKSGANLNYTIEWLCYASLFVGLLVAHMARPAAEAGAARVSPFPALLLLPPLVFGGLPITAGDLELHRRERAALLEEIRAAPGPVLSDDMVLLLKAGKSVPWESAIFAELGSTGQWDEGLIIDRIRRRDFAFIITEETPESDVFRSRYNPAVAAAIAEAYPVSDRRAYMTVHRPAAGAAAGTVVR